jgi:adenine-specific DNA-methyltransferase
MNSLIEKETLAGQVQMFYFDPPYGIKYGSNFQPFVNKRDVKDGKDEDLTSEPEMLRAFRDTWELGIHSYLTYMRDRLLLMRELLHETGSIFVQISDENVHHVREIMDEVFGAGNFVTQIPFYKTTSQTSEKLPQTKDYLIWYAKDSTRSKYRALFLEKTIEAATRTGYDWIEEQTGERRALTVADRRQLDSLLKAGTRLCSLSGLTSSSGGETTQFEYVFRGRPFRPSKGGWKTNLSGDEAA